MNACKFVLLNLARNKVRSRVCFNLNNQPRILLSFDSNNRQQSKNEKQNRYRVATSIVALTGLMGLGYYKLKHSISIANCEKEKSSDNIEPGSFVKGLPSFTQEQVAKHCKSSDKIWCSYKNGVYDITDFVDSHPGGNKILLGAGKSLEPFWEIYAVHKQKNVFEILEAYRIGNLIIEKSNETKQSTGLDPFENEPKRNPLLTVRTQKPFNAETPKQLSVDDLITSNELFFVRNHLPVPKIDTKKFRLEIIRDGDKSVSLSLNELKSLQLPVHTIPVTIQCSGNKRRFMNDYETVQGLMWDVNAISNAEWTGFKLKDLLNYYDINLEDERIKHVQFEGLDLDPTGSPYGASIPKEKVLSDYGDVLIAFKMNGQDIPLDHGFPVRVVVPGVVGARSVKWLNKIILSGGESKSHWQVNDYKILSPSIKDLKKADFSAVRPIQECNVQSGICEPFEGSEMKRGETAFIKGYAYSGGGNDIDRVVVSLDGGRTWNEASLKKFQRPLYKCWSWTLWEFEVEMPKDRDMIEIVCVATDTSGNTQPESVKSIWNARGLMNNAWHRVNVKLK